MSGRVVDQLPDDEAGADKPMRQALELSDIVEATNLVKWMNAEPGTPRDDAALGAIYHSTPAISSAPRYDTVDDDFNEWRRRETIQGRPQVLYVGTTDGVLHAFSTGDFRTGVTGWRNSTRGVALCFIRRCCSAT